MKSMMIFSENADPYGKKGGSNGRARICKVCGKEGSWNMIRDHIEAKHITGISIPCDTCGKAYRSRNLLRGHKSYMNKKTQ